MSTARYAFSAMTVLLAFVVSVITSFTVRLSCRNGSPRSSTTHMHGYMLTAVSHGVVRRCGDFTEHS